MAILSFKNRENKQIRIIMNEGGSLFTGNTTRSSIYLSDFTQLYAAVSKACRIGTEDL